MKTKEEIKQEVIKHISLAISGCYELENNFSYNGFLFTKTDLESAEENIIERVKE